MTGTEVYQLVLANPGKSARELATIVDKPTGTVQPVLQTLVHKQWLSKSGRGHVSDDPYRYWPSEDGRIALYDRLKKARLAEEEARKALANCHQEVWAAEKAIIAATATRSPFPLKAA